MLIRHGLRNALLPVVARGQRHRRSTSLQVWPDRTGVGLPGVGQLMVTAICHATIRGAGHGAGDHVVVVNNIIVDLGYCLVDPRISSMVDAHDVIHAPESRAEAERAGEGDVTVAFRTPLTAPPRSAAPDRRRDGAVVDRLTFAAPWLTVHDPLEIADASLSPPSSQYLLGTDQLGRDVLTRILYAARSSLAWLAERCAGICVRHVLGLIAGYSTGLIDACLMRVLDILQAFPHCCWRLRWWPRSDRTCRIWCSPWGCCSCRVSPRRARLDAVGTGAGLHRCGHRARRVPRADPIPARLPNIAAPLIVEASLTVTIAILTEASLSFLGLGVQPPDPPGAA